MRSHEESRHKTSVFRDIEDIRFNYNFVDELVEKDNVITKNFVFTKKNSICIESELVVRKEETQADPQTDSLARSSLLKRNSYELKSLIRFEHDEIALSEEELLEIETQYSILEMETMNRIIATSKGKSGKFVSEMLQMEMRRIFTFPFIIQTRRPSHKFINAVLRIQKTFRRAKNRKLKEGVMKPFVAILTG